MLTEYIHKVISFDYEIIKKVKETIGSDIEVIKKFTDEEVLTQYKDNDPGLLEHLVQLFIKNLIVELPKSDETTLETQVAAFDAYSEALDKVLDSWVSTELANSSLVGDISEHIDVIKPIVKAYYIRRWMSENNFLPEINELVTSDDQGGPCIDLYDISKSHITSLMKSTFKLIKTMQKNKETMDENLSTIGAEEPEPTETEPEGGEGEPEDDLGGLNEPLPEETPEEPLPEEDNDTTNKTPEDTAPKEV
jgi:hypothetical protein